MTPLTPYDEIRRAISDDRRVQNGTGKSAEWAKLALTIGVTIVSLTLAYAALDKRMSLLEQKLDALAASVALNRR